MSEKIMENWLNKTSAKQADVENSNIENSIEVAERAMSVSSSSNDELILETESDSSSADIISALPIRNKIVSRGKYAAAAWKVDPLLQDWLESANSENTKMRCKLCHVNLMPKMSVFKQHLNSTKHKMAASSINLNKKIEFKQITLNKQTKINELRSALYICCHSSINCVDHFISVQKKNCEKTNVQNMTLNRTKCTAVIKNVIYPNFIESIKSDIGDSSFSLIIDESTDISIKKYLGIVIKYYSSTHKDIITLFLKLVLLEDCTAVGIVEAIKTTLKELGLPLQNLCGIGTDNASVMVGINNGVYKKLKNEIPRLILIPCVCHSLQLAVSAAASACIPKEIEFLIAETYNWFSHSSSRQASYSKLYGLINDGHDPKKIVRSCETRWMSIYSAIKRISEQWLELKTHFSTAKTSEKCYKATLLNDIYSKNTCLAYIQFLKFILQEVTKVNNIFESNKADVTKLIDDLIFLIKFVVHTLVPISMPNFDPLQSPLDKEIWYKHPYLGSETENILSEMDIESEEQIREMCGNFLQQLAIQLRQRLPANINILKKINCFSLDNYYNKPNTKAKIKDLLKEFEKPNKTDKIMNQLNNSYLIEWKNDKNTIKFWDEIYKYKDADGIRPFQDLAEFAFLFLTLPFSNAEVERAFSKMNILKTKLRNRMGLPLLNSLLTIKTWMKQQGKCCHDYEITDELTKKIGTKSAYVNCDNEDCEEAYILDLVNIN